MGIWAEIKHALNSTLGTSSFKPLNTLITDHVTSKTTTITDHVTSKVSASETNVKNHVTSETTGVETHVTTKVSASETNVKNHVTSETNTVKSRLEEMKFQPMRVITSTTTFTPEKTGKYKVICVGKGGNGSSYASTTSVGGGAGGVSIKTLELSSATSYSITISTTGASFSNILSAVGGSNADGTTIGTGGTASGGDYNYTGGNGSKTNSSAIISANGGSVGVYLSELSRLMSTVIPNPYTTNDVIIGWYGSSILNYGAGAPGSVSNSGGGPSIQGLPACVIIIQLA